MLSTLCGGMSQRAFKKHIAECGVCWSDAQGRIDLEFDPSKVPNPNEEEEDDAEDEGAWTNHYYHHGVQWDDVWSCQSNDECPVCHHEIEPYASTENASGELVIHNQKVNDMADEETPCCATCGDAECDQHKEATV